MEFETEYSYGGSRMIRHAANSQSISSNPSKKVMNHSEVAQT